MPTKHNDMHSIKFRAWNKYNGMMDVQSLRTFGLGYHELADHVSCFYDEEHGSYSTWFGRASARAARDGGKESCALMQFTGFADSKGKEVYESDILKLCTGNTKEDGDPYVLGWISWLDGRFVFIEDASGDILEPSEYLLLGKFDGEVVGNMYQNPGLLTTAQQGKK